MRKEIERNEIWPVYSVSESDKIYCQDFAVELSEEELERFRRVQKEYDQMQKELGEKYEQCEKRSEQALSSHEQLRACLLEVIKRNYGPPQNIPGTSDADARAYKLRSSR